MKNEQLNIPNNDNNQNNVLIEIPLIVLSILEFMPFFYSLDSRVLYAIKLFFLAVFMVGMLSENSKLFTKALIIFFVVNVFNVYWHYQVWDRYDVGVLFIITRGSMIWMYMIASMYLCRFGRESFKRVLKNLSIILLSITSLTTIRTLLIYPEASRSLGNGHVVNGVETETLLRMNTATWGLVYGMAISVAFLLCEYKKTRKKTYLLISIIISTCVALSQITFALLMVLVIWVWVMLFYTEENKKKKIAIIIILVVAVALYINRESVLLLLYSLLENWGIDTLARRFYQLYISVRLSAWYGDSQARFDLYLRSIETFVNHPIMGYHVTSSDGIYLMVGMHSTIFDILASTGLVGVVCAFVPFVYVSRYIKTNINTGYSMAYIISLTLIIFFNVINPTNNSLQAYYAAFILPMLSSDGTQEKTIKFVFRH